MIFFINVLLLTLHKIFQWYRYCQSRNLQRQNWINNLITKKKKKKSKCCIALRADNGLPRSPSQSIRKIYGFYANIPKGWLVGLHTTHHSFQSYFRQKFSSKGDLKLSPHSGTEGNLLSGNWVIFCLKFNFVYLFSSLI